MRHKFVKLPQHVIDERFESAGVKQRSLVRGHPLARTRSRSLALDHSLSRSFTRFSLYLSHLLAQSCRVVLSRGTIELLELNGGRGGDHE